MWAYATYLAVGEDSYKIFAMLVPWLLLFGYLKLLPQWDYTATVAASTPIVVNLGRLYTNVYRQENFVLLRIQETIIGISLGIVLTILIFPIFAVDLLKTNIQGK
jgi:type III secretory pathway component EscT